MQKILWLLVAALALVACKEDPPPTDWEVVSTQGKVRFVVINKGDGLDKNIYRQAMPDICPKDSDCQALFWKKGDSIPSSVPLSDADFATLMAFYAVQTNPPQKNLRWNCQRFSGVTQDICLDKSFITGHVNP